MSGQAVQAPTTATGVSEQTPDDDRAAALTSAAEAEAGFELFRRAICERDDEAWSTVVAQYRRLVLASIYRHPGSRQLVQDDLYWVNRTFQRFWSAVRPERFEHFNGLAAILAYLKMCAVSVVLDDLQAKRRADLTSLDDVRGESVAQTDHANAVVSRLHAADVWAAVLEALTSDAERIVARQSFVGGLSPREIFARHPEQFATVDDVYRVKRNLLDRLVHTPAIRRFLD